jgi:ssRNA-specific RNase YbeY (16S rRNA maturation enzyme)
MTQDGFGEVEFERVIMHVLIHVFGFDVVEKESKQEIMSMDQRGVRECGEASI